MVASPGQYPPGWIGGFVVGSSPLGAPSQWPVSPLLQKTINSYLYVQYQDDDNLQAFVDAYNVLTQEYVDWFNAVGLPVYIGLSGQLLDWAAQGLYGITRPLLPQGQTQDIGEFNTFELNGIEFDGEVIIGPQSYYFTTDDVFKRILTWSLYKGDGKVFNIRWLKRRVMRFLTGAAGTGGTPVPSAIVMATDAFGRPIYWPTFYNIDNTYQISVSIVGNEATIRIVGGVRTIAGDAELNGFEFNDIDSEFDSMQSTYETLGNFALAPIFKAAVDAGVLELPFQYTWNVQIG